ncbi:MAG: TolC family protein [Candidatus Omnitrophica bacterium]|nr:TolC family protein [Candidatus Omnitrophota bacterium]
MKRLVVATIIMSVVCVCYPVVAAADGDDGGRTLSLTEFIRLASEKDTSFEEILIDELALQYEKALQLPAKDLVIEVKSQYVTVLEEDEEAPENTVSLSKLFPLQGTDITAEYNSSIKSSTYDITSDYSIIVSQPIAENAFGRANRLLDKIVGIETDIARHQIIEAYEDYLATLIQRYFDWYSAFENVKTAENSYRENVKLLENIKEREKKSVALPIDVNKIQLQVLAKEENLVALRTTYARSLTLIKEAIRYEGDEAFIPEQPVLYEDRTIDFAGEYRRFTDASRTYKALTMLEEKSSLKVDKAADALLPSIDLFAGFSVDGTGHDVVPTDKQAFAGVSLEWPLPSQVERAEYETAKIARDKTALGTEGTYARLHTSLSNLYDQIERERRLIELSDQKIKLAQSIVEDETENYSFGKVTLNDLIDEVNKLEDNKFNKISHEVQLKKLIVEWLRLTDTLVAQNRVEDIRAEGVF